MQRLVGIALQDLGEDLSVEREVTGLLHRDLRQNAAEHRFILADHPAGVAVRVLGGALLQCGVDEHPVRITIPLRLEPGLDVLEHEHLEGALLDHPRVPHVVGEHGAVAILLGRPEVVPLLPVRRSPRCVASRRWKWAGIPRSGC